MRRVRRAFFSDAPLRGARPEKKLVSLRQIVGSFPPRALPNIDLLFESDFAGKQRETEPAVNAPAGGPLWDSRCQTQIMGRAWKELCVLSPKTKQETGVVG